MELGCVVPQETRVTTSSLRVHVPHRPGTSIPALHPDHHGNAASASGRAAAKSIASTREAPAGPASAALSTHRALKKLRPLPRYKRPPPYFLLDPLLFLPTLRAEVPNVSKHFSGNGSIRGLNRTDRRSSGGGSSRRQQKIAMQIACATWRGTFPDR